MSRISCKEVISPHFCSREDSIRFYSLVYGKSWNVRICRISGVLQERNWNGRQYRGHEWSLWSRIDDLSTFSWDWVEKNLRMMKCAFHSILPLAEQWSARSREQTSLSTPPSSAFSHITSLPFVKSNGFSCSESACCMRLLCSSVMLEAITRNHVWE